MVRPCDGSLPVVKTSLCCRAGMHAAVAEVTNRFRTEVTAFFFPDPSRMEKHMKMYQKQGIRDFMPVISEQRSPLIYK